MRKFGQYSLVDFLVNLIPNEWKSDPNYVNPKTIQSLYSIWKNPNNKIGNKIYKRPNTISDKDVEAMIDSGLIIRSGEKIQITSKGSDIIKTMILGDDRSSYEDKGHDIDYHTASQNIKMAKRSKKRKVADLWWDTLDGK